MNAPFLEAIDHGRRFLLTGHERPDGDCIGAAVAMFHLLCALGKEVVICNPDPAPSAFDFLDEHTPIGSPGPDFDVGPFDVCMLLDCAHLARLGRMRQLVERQEPMFAVIDHHVGSESGDGDVAFVDTCAPATGAMVLELVDHFSARDSRVQLTRPIAEAVFLSIVSDTGWFRYSNTTPKVFEIAARLTAAGVDSARLYDLIYRRNHPDSVAYLAGTIEKCKLESDGRFGHVVIDRESVDRAGRIRFDHDLVMEPLRAVEGVEVVAMIKEYAGRVVKLSLRASGDVDVQAIAARLGGGGHKKAAGATVEGTPSEVLERLRVLVSAGLEAAGGAR